MMLTPALSNAVTSGILVSLQTLPQNNNNNNNDDDDDDFLNYIIII